MNKKQILIDRLKDKFSGFGNFKSYDYQLVDGSTDVAIRFSCWARTFTVLFNVKDEWSNNRVDCLKVNSTLTSDDISAIMEDGISDSLKSKMEEITDICKQIANEVNGGYSE